MKMSDWFNLPMAANASDTIEDSYLNEIAEFPNDKEAEAAAHAINLHDELVEALELCIYVIDMCGVQMEIGHEDSPCERREKVGEILAKARGEG